MCGTSLKRRSLRARPEMSLSRGTSPGRRLVRRLLQPKTRFERNSSSSQARNRESGSAGSRVRLLRLVSNRSVCGNQYISKCSLLSTSSSKRSRASSQRIGASWAARVNIGSTRSVTEVRMPSAPRPIRARASTSGFSSASARSRVPSPVTISRPTTWALSEATRPPVPWVPVEMAPAMVCSAMSPMLCSDRPSFSRAVFSSCSGVPASTVMVIASRSTPTTPRRLSGRSSRPSVRAMSVKEWPVPGILTTSSWWRADSTASTTSPASCGVSSPLGCAVLSPDQLVHVPMRGRLARPGPGRAAWPPAA